MSRRSRAGGSAPWEPELTQELADLYIQTPKLPLEPDQVIEFAPGMNCEVDFKGKVEPERFRLIIERSEIDKTHAKFELLVRNSITLLRLEINGSPHRNPDRMRVAGTHLHTYREGFGDGWAEPITDEFGDTSNLLACLGGFLGYCNVVHVPSIRVIRSLLP